MLGAAHSVHVSARERAAARARELHRDRDRRRPQRAMRSRPIRSSTASASSSIAKPRRPSRAWTRCGPRKFAPKLFWATARKHFMGAWNCAASLIDIALWDIKGKALGPADLETAGRRAQPAAGLYHIRAAALQHRRADRGRAHADQRRPDQPQDGGRRGRARARRDSRPANRCKHPRGRKAGARAARGGRSGHRAHDGRQQGRDLRAGAAARQAVRAL